MTSKPSFIIGELIVLFVLIPLFLTLDIHIAIKVSTVVSSIIYCIWIARKHKLILIKSLYQVDLKSNLWRILLTFTTIALSSMLYLYYVQPENLFIVVRQKPLLWLIILFVYAILSVYPQELMYRSFYFARYKNIFSKPYYLIWTNILVFPLAHLFFDNLMVLVVTLIGGMIFTATYYRTKSVMLTSIEHAIYGNWLFTIGMGEMLAFPMPN